MTSRLAWAAPGSWLPRRTVSPEAMRIAQERDWLYTRLSMMDINASRAIFYMLVALNTVEAAGIESMDYAWYPAIGYACDMIPLRRTACYYCRFGARWLEQESDNDSREARTSKAGTYISLGIHEYTATGERAKALDHLQSARETSSAVGEIRFWSSVNNFLSDLRWRFESSRALDSVAWKTPPPGSRSATRPSSRRSLGAKETQSLYLRVSFWPSLAFLAPGQPLLYNQY